MIIKVPLVAEVQDPFGGINLFSCNRSRIFHIGSGAGDHWSHDSQTHCADPSQGPLQFEIGTQVSISLHYFLIYIITKILFIFVLFNCSI